MADYLKPVVFRLDEQYYGIDISLVNGIETYQAISPVPNAFEYIKGILNIRNEVIPVYDLRKKFNMAKRHTSDEKSKLIVVRLSECQVAIEVDEVSDIHDFTEKDVVPMPKIVMNEKITFMDRVANYNGKLVVLLDVTRLLSEEEMEKVKKLKEDLK